MTARHMLPILAAAPQEAPVSDFEYKRDGKNVTLTQYTGNTSELVIPEKIDKLTVTELGENLFKGNTDLTRVSIPDTVTKIGKTAFESCSNLGSVKMSKSIETIGQGCFSGCRRLKEISFPKRIQTRGWAAFLGSDSLDTLITDDGAQLLRIGADAREYTVHASVQEIAPSAFHFNNRIERVAFEKGTIRICDVAFRGCRNLESVTLPQTLENIQDGVFSQCLSLTEVVFTGGCPKTGQDLFKESPNVTVYYNPSASGWKPDSDGKWAKYGVPLRPLDKAKLAALKLPPAKPAAPAPAVAAAPSHLVPAAAFTSPPPGIQPPANGMPAAEFDALYAEKLPQFPPALQKLRAIFTNETAKIDLDRVRGHAAALEDYAVNLDKLPVLFAQRADLDGVKAADAAKELAYKGEVPAGGIRPELAALSATYARRCAAADAKAADAVVALTSKYTNALNASLRDLLLKKDIQTAELYKLEIDAADRARHAAQTGKSN